MGQSDMTTVVQTRILVSCMIFCIREGDASDVPRSSVAVRDDRHTPVLERYMAGCNINDPAPSLSVAHQGALLQFPSFSDKYTTYNHRYTYDCPSATRSRFKAKMLSL